jgi:GntR family transcriptional regulator, arabinose operon transcriptional repressor
MLHPIDTMEATPRHQQVYNQLLGCIQSDYWRVGEKIPAELELAEELCVAKLTVHRAVQALARDGWVVRHVGRGTFVAPRTPTKPLQRVVLTFGASARNILGSDYYGRLYAGIAEALEPQVELILSTEPLGTHPLPPADGVLAIAPRQDSLESLRALAQQGTPTLVLGAHWPELGLPTVDSDNQAAARLAVVHLAELGHTHLALIYTEPETANLRDRLSGFRAEAAQRGLTALEQEASASWKLSCDEKAALLAAVRQGVTAIFAAGYYLALDVLNALREAQVRVPEDVSVVGFDDPVSAQLVYPPLTTLRQPLHAMGRRAVERLVALAAGDDDSKQELLAVELIVRSSTTKPKEN